jgi:AAA+ ATPase superfamily predicted ATPase
MEFIDREPELSALEKFRDKNNPQLIVIYGKRRVGKTELIKHFIKPRPHIYFLAQKVTEHENLRMLGAAIGEFFNDELLVLHGFDGWKSFFLYLKKHLFKKCVLVIDEFPYLAEANKAISSIFQSGWDEFLKDTPVFLILCGSSIAMMESETLAYKAPLYGRRTGQIMLKPFPFSVIKKFYPGLSFTSRMQFYSVTGGNPSYLKQLNPRASLDKNIKENILRPEQLLYGEVEFILREELREPRNYLAILKAIALSKNKVSEIANETGLDKGILHKYLFILEDLQIIRKEIPVTEKHPLKSRKGIYKLQDQFFRFWFKYVLPNKSAIEEGRIDFVAQKIKRDFNLLVSENYEEVAREIVRDYEPQFFPINQIGRWWDKNEEIDIVALNEETMDILFGEVKWSNKPVGTNIYADLKRKSKLVEWHSEKRNEYFCLLSKSGFTDDMKELAIKEHVLLIEGDKLINK